MGTCGVTCLGGSTLCGNSCVNTQSDPAHCGSCTNVCGLPQAGAACYKGGCVIGQCNAGYADCNRVASDGCEVNTANDASNCGQCGNACGNGISCTNGTCGCTPTGQRQSFNTLSNSTVTGCVTGNPCPQDAYVVDPANALDFQGFGQSFTCSAAAPACVQNVGINTTNIAGTCQGIWDVSCDGVLMGTINTLNTTCGVSAMTNGSGCRLTFAAPRMCTNIKLVADVDTDTNSTCCGVGTPDSAILGVSVW
jgi:hypothetical protein